MIGETPSTNGRFKKGNPGGPGNPFAGKVQQFRLAMLEAVTSADLRKVMAALVKKAKAGDVSAIRETLDRLLGKAMDAPDILERIVKLEEILKENKP